MGLKQSFDRSQPKTIKDFFAAAEKSKAKPKGTENNNFFTQLVQKSQAA